MRVCQFLVMCVRVFSVGFGPGLVSMSPARSRRSASHAAGTHGRLPQKTGPPGRRGRWIQFAQCSPDSPPDCGTNHEHGVSVWFNSEIGSALDLNFERLGFDPHCG